MAGLITFTSRACADVSMLPDTARAVLGIIGKPLGERGVIRVAEMPDAIARLDAAMQGCGNQDQALATESRGAAPHRATTAVASAIAIDCRGWPILDMLRQSRDGNADILWGV